MSLLYSFLKRKNLLLAWKRIRTGQNIGYKRFFRTVFDGLEIGIDYELASLRAKLVAQTYSPESAQRVLVAKPSGLQRPLSFLDPRDQIIYQAIANIAAKRIEPTRQLVVARSVCSNRIGKNPDSIYFFESWQNSYRLFRNRIEIKLNAGFNYAADFDLASFYDTVSHTQLADMLFNQNKHITSLLLRCLQAWQPRRIRHGLPQGPIASDYLAECYLLLIDRELAKRKINYLRYVDDILIFGKSSSEVQSGIVALEAICREHGLVPQAGKFKPGRKVRRASELMNSVSGYAYMNFSDGPLLSEDGTITAYTAAFSGRNRIIAQATLAKRALFRGVPSNRIISRVLKDIENNPAFIEAYAVYLSRFGYRKRIARFIQKSIMRKSPYLFVQGEYWNILTAASKTIYPRMVLLARRLLTSTDGYPVTLRLALYAVLLKDANRANTKLLIKSLRQERTDWVRAWAISHFERVLSFPEAKRFATVALTREALSAYSSAKLHAESVIFPPGFPLPKKKFSQSATASLCRLGIVRRSARRPPEAISAVLAAGFRTQHWNGWRKLLASNYDQARICLQLSLGEFDGNPSSWMGNLDSFNDITIRSVMDLVRNKLAPPGLPTAKDRRGQLTNYGYFLKSKGTDNWFARTHPTICDPFRDFHERRNQLPSSHAFDKITSLPSKLLRHSERDGYVKKLRTGYNRLQRLAQSLM